MSAELLTVEFRMSAFAQTFPSVTDAPGVRLWDAQALDRWASETPVSRGQLVTVQFLLTVWDPGPGSNWRCGPFDLMDAIVAWDPAHRAAFVRWCEEPWWP